MLVKDLRTKSDKELLKLIEDLKAQLFMLRFQNKTGQLDKPHKISNIKKDIAKIFTILNARELSLEQKIKSSMINDKNNSPIEQKPLDNKLIKETKVKKEIDVKISKQKVDKESLEQKEGKK